jgi:hypothetical protein
MNCVCFVGLQDLGREFFSFFLRVGIGEILGRKYRGRKAEGERETRPPLIQRLASCWAGVSWNPTRPTSLIFLLLKSESATSFASSVVAGGLLTPPPERTCKSRRPRKTHVLKFLKKVNIQNPLYGPSMYWYNHTTN